MAATELTPKLAAFRAAKPEQYKQGVRRWYANFEAEFGVTYRRLPANRITYLATQAKRRAKKSGLDYEPALKEKLQSAPPVACACCGRTFDYSSVKRSHNVMPSLDRHDNNKGYTISNVRVICYRCNMLKRDATIEEIEAVLAYMRS